ncbi:MAG: TetR/AcrR family transcriptional regulator [Hyphomicrobiales bacterium]|nr:TetR/AcrR family transcriptional regulator [Hyphomicrobiales bacterium]
MAHTDTSRRKQAVSDLKRTMILDAARAVFESEGLEGASLRAIAAAAGYTPAAIYFHFESKEAIYAELLQESLSRLHDAIAEAARNSRTPEARLMAAAMGFFRYYAKRPRDLDLGFYLFRGGMKPAGLGPERDEALNEALEAALLPIKEAVKGFNASDREATLVAADIFAHATGLLLLTHTGRIRMFGVSAEQRMRLYVDAVISALKSASAS